MRFSLQRCMFLRQQLRPRALCIPTRRNQRRVTVCSFLMLFSSYPVKIARGWARTTKAAPWCCCSAVCTLPLFSTVFHRAPPAAAVLAGVVWQTSRTAELRSGAARAREAALLCLRSIRTARAINRSLCASRSQHWSPVRALRRTSLTDAWCARMRRHAGKQSLSKPATHTATRHAECTTNNCQSRSMSCSRSARASERTEENAQEATAGSVHCLLIFDAVCVCAATGLV